MAIKIKGDTIINDSRVIVNADKIGIGQYGTNPPKYDLEILPDTNNPAGIAVSAVNVQSDDTNKAISVFNSPSGIGASFTVSHRGRVDAVEYYGTFKGTIDPSTSDNKIEQGDTTAEVIDTGTDGRFIVTTNGTERVIVDPSGYLNTRADIRLRRTASNDGALYFGDSNNNYIFGGDSVEVLTFETGGTGDFVIGETVTGSTSNVTAIVKSWNSSTRELGIYNKTGNFNLPPSAETVTGASASWTTSSFTTTNEDVLTFATAGEERLRITRTGNVGIGTDDLDDPVTSSNTAKLAVGIVTAHEFRGGTFYGTIDSTVNSISLNHNLRDVFSVSGNQLMADSAGGDKIVFWDNDGGPINLGELTYLSLDTNTLEIDDTTLKVKASAVGKNYTLPFTGTNGGNGVGIVTWTLTDDVTPTAGTDPVTLLAGSNISISSVDETNGKFTIDAVQGAGVGIAASASAVLNVNGGEIGGVNPGLTTDKLVYWDEDGTYTGGSGKLDYLTVGTGLEIVSGELQIDTNVVGKTYTLPVTVEDGTSGSGGASGIATFTLTDDANPVVEDPVTIEAGSGIVIESRTNGLKISADISEGGGGGVSDVQVKQYSDNADPRTERNAQNPIDVQKSVGIVTIGIGTTSNAYGNRFVGPNTPSGAIEGDIWYDTTTSGQGKDRVAVLRDEKAAGSYGGKPGSGEYSAYKSAYYPPGPGGNWDPDSWFPRNINTEYDPSNFVSVGIGSTNVFGLEAGSYKISWRVPAHQTDRFQSRLAYNTNSDFSGTTSYYYGTSQYSGGHPQYPSGGNPSDSGDESEGEYIANISETTYFRIEQWIYAIPYYGSGTDFSESALGVAINRDSQSNAILNPLAPGHEVYTQVKIEDLSTAVKDDGNTNRIIQGNTKAEVIDTNGDGHFIVETEGAERFRITPDAHAYFNTCVGIGSTTPREKFDVIGKQIITDDGGDVLTLESNASTSRTTIKLNTNGNDWEIGARGSETPNASNSFYVYDYETSEYRLVINPTGNVGIGTKDAIAKLDVRGGTTGITTSVVISGSVGIGITHPDSALDVVSSKTDGTNTHLGGAYNDDGQIAVRRIEFGTKNYRNSIQSQQGSGGDNFSSDIDLLLNPLGGNVGVGTIKSVQKFQVGFGTQGFVVSAGGTVGIGTTNPKTKLDVHGTDAIVVPVGTTAERPSNASSGMFRYNTTEGQFEGYTNSWGAIAGSGGGSGSGDSFVLLSEKTATGTSVEFTGIPSDAMEITLMFKGVSGDWSNSFGQTNHFLVELGTSSGYITSGYVSNSTTASASGSGVHGHSSEAFTNAFGIYVGSSSNEVHGSMIINKASSTSYTEIGDFRNNNNDGSISRGSLSSVSGTIDRLRIRITNVKSFDAGTMSVSYKTPGSGSTSGTTKIALIQDEKPSGTNGGASTTNTWVVRDLNTITDPNSVGISSVSDGKFSLPAGSYAINFSAPAFHVDEFQARLAYNTNENFSGTTNYIYGSSSYSGYTAVNPSDIASHSQDRSFGDAILTLSEITYFRVEQNNDNNENNSNRALGTPSSRGNNEVYTQVRVQDLATAIKKQDLGTTKVAVLQDVRTQGTNGGQASTNNWHGRRLNSKIDPQNFVTIVNGTTGINGTANTFSLEAGTYLLQWRAPGFDSGDQRAKIAYTTSTNYNTLFNSQSSTGVSYLSGESAQSQTNYESNIFATGSATITITQTTYFRLQHYVTSNDANSSKALGEAGNITDENEIYSQVIVQDLETAVKSQDTGRTKIAIIQDEKSNGVNGGSAASTATWLTRDLNTISDPNSLGITSTSNGEFSLPSGTYKIKFSAPGFWCKHYQSRITYSTAADFSVSPSYIQGSSEFSGGTTTVGENIQSRSRGEGVITLTDTTYFKLEQKVSYQQGVSDGNSVNETTFGVPGYGGGGEVYSQVMIEDLATAVKSQDTGTTRVAVVRDQKNYGVDAGDFDKDAWRDRDLTVKDDPFGFVTLYPTSNGETTPSPANDPGYFSLPAGKYKIKFSAPAYKVNQHQAAMVWSSNESDINKTYDPINDHRDGDAWGSTEFSSDTDGRVTNRSKGAFVVEITQKSYFKVIHYGKDTQNNNGFGSSANISSVDPNIFTIVEIEDLATAVKSGVNASNKIEQGNTSAEVVDTGTNGHFKITTEDEERFRVNSDGDIVFSHLRASDSVQITAGGIYRRVIQIDDSATADGGYVDQIQTLFRIGEAHGSFAGTLYVTVNDLMVSMSKVYHFTTSFGAGTTDRIRTMAGINQYATFDMGAGIKYNSSLNGGYPDSMYYRDLCVKVNYTKNRNASGQVTVGPASPSISATLILAQNSTGINVTKPTQSYSTLTVSAETIPSSSSSSGMKGEMASDSNYVYICTGTNTWKRIALDPY